MNIFQSPGAVVRLVVLISGATFANTSNAVPIQADKFYTVTPSDQSTELWSIDPLTGVTQLVTSLSLPSGDSPSFRSNAIAFNPDNRLYGWSNSDRQLYEVDYSSGQVNFIGTPGDSTTPKWINGLSFTRDGTLYGLAGAGDTLYTIDVSSGAVSSVGPSYVDIKHNGMAIDFATDMLYAVSGWGEGKPDYLVSINPDPEPVIDEIHASDTTGNYTWSSNGASGVGAGYDATGAAIRLDATYGGGGCCWNPATLTAEREMDIPSSGYAKLDVSLTADAAGQSRLIFFIKEDDNNWYRFRMTDDTYGSSGYSQGLSKMVDGVLVNEVLGAGSIALGGTETGNVIDSINENLLVEFWWEPSYMRLVVTDADTNDVIYSRRMNTSDTTIINPDTFVVRAQRLELDWKSVEINPGVTQIAQALNTDFDGVGAEFSPITGELFTLRDSNRLMGIDIFTGISSEYYATLDNLASANLAAPWRVPVSAPGSLSLLVAGLVLLGWVRKRGAAF